jgi:hypothetical protein
LGSAYNAISKSGTADVVSQQVHWTVTVDTKGQTIPDLTVYDLLVYGGSALNLGTVTGIPADISTSDLTQRYNQKYEENSFAGSGLQIMVYPIERDGVRVADLLKITGFVMDAVNTFHFDTIVLNPAVFAGNSTTSVTNTATLFSANTKLNAATNSVNYPSRMLIKRMLTRTAAADPASGVNSGITNDMSLGFNYQKNRRFPHRRQLQRHGSQQRGQRRGQTSAQRPSPIRFRRAGNSPKSPLVWIILSLKAPAMPTAPLWRRIPRRIPWPA